MIERISVKLSEPMKLFSRHNENTVVQHYDSISVEFENLYIYIIFINKNYTTNCLSQ
jgi:hypothetical protein